MILPQKIVQFQHLGVQHDKLCRSIDEAVEIALKGSCAVAREGEGAEVLLWQAIFPVQSVAFMVSHDRDEGMICVGSKGREEAFPLPFRFPVVCKIADVSKEGGFRASGPACSESVAQDLIGILRALGIGKDQCFEGTRSRRFGAWREVSSPNWCGNRAGHSFLPGNGQQGENA